MKLERLFIMELIEQTGQFGKIKFGSIQWRKLMVLTNIS